MNWTRPVKCTAGKLRLCTKAGITHTFILGEFSTLVHVVGFSSSVFTEKPGCDLVKCLGI